MKPVQNTPLSLFSVDVGKSFSDQHPRVARLLQITAIVLGLLAVFAAVVVCIASPVALPVAGVLMGIGGALLFSSVHALARNIKELSRKEKRDQLYISSSHSEEVISRDDKDPGSLDSYNAMVKKFQELNLQISNRAQEIFQNSGKEGQEIAEGIERISENYRTCVDLLKKRQEAHRYEIIVDSKEASPHYRIKNALLVNIGMDIADKLPKAGGAFSLRFKGLSKIMEKIHKGITVGLAIGGIACIALIAALIPGSILALPLLVAATLGISMAVIGLSYGLREILKRTKINKQKLCLDLMESVDFKLLKDMTKYQDALLQLLVKMLSSEIRIAELSEPIYKKFYYLETKLTYLQEHLQEMEFKLKFMSKGYARRAFVLEQAVSRVSESTGETGEQTPEETSEGFDELIAMGEHFAQERRRKDREEQISLSNYSVLSPEEQNFGDSWHPKGSRQLERFWTEDIKLGKSDQLLLTEGIADELVTLRKEIGIIKQAIQETSEKFQKAKDFKLRAGQGSDELISLWHYVRSSTYSSLNVLRNLQFTLIKIMQEGNKEDIS
ncbi:hypothetical protein [Chlamydia avium]|uniref:IncA family protein n=1 Tax=Chlamydia avium 10DC88 TaxID=1229831 RepID=W8JFQ4_9CHLA|nr:hypothetical protein [Chlamydia avium]AHK63030.1 Uncharacterized protein M832_01610 [Chlamydia avium 10DC88]